jgi:hypothetical protein
MITELKISEKFPLIFGAVVRRGEDKFRLLVLILDSTNVNQ